VQGQGKNNGSVVTFSCFGNQFGVVQIEAVFLAFQKIGKKTH
jgi:hypothetical protein